MSIWVYIHYNLSIHLIHPSYSAYPIHGYIQPEAYPRWHRARGKPWTGSQSVEGLKYKDANRTD